MRAHATHQQLDYCETLLPRVFRAHLQAATFQASCCKALKPCRDAGGALVLQGQAEGAMADTRHTRYPIKIAIEDTN